MKANWLLHHERVARHTDKVSRVNLAAALGDALTARGVPSYLGSGLDEGEKENAVVLVVVETTSAYLLGLLNWSRADFVEGTAAQCWVDSRVFTFNSAMSTDLAMMVRMVVMQSFQSLC